jgi:hypothetical protein
MLGLSHSGQALALWTRTNLKQTPQQVLVLPTSAVLLCCADCASPAYPCPADHCCCGHQQGAPADARLHPAPPGVPHQPLLAGGAAPAPTRCCGGRRAAGTDAGEGREEQTCGEAVLQAFACLCVISGYSRNTGWVSCKHLLPASCNIVATA